ncbi:TIM barrel protein [Pseudogemmobacter sp. W21_MBD1_M6]|uniref:TIM barrel protein n=1 Tax=Pseudogemmobacter sp. W21_MBD1_M6 TaxID=3240271 RepID=UPI003F947B48
MTAPAMRYDAFLDLAAALGCVGVEFRNDLPGALFDGDSPEAVRGAAKKAGVRILALAEVKRFNDWSDEKREEARALMEIASACGAEAVSLIPRNDGLGMGNGERQANLRVALRELKPLLQEYNLIGMVEPLGFEVCALRYKSEAVDAIEAMDAAGQFKLVHDTFHHHLAGGGPLFPEHTGIVHISGVTDGAVRVSDMQDAHRLLVDAQDRLGNIDQIEALMATGYTGPISFEPFSPVVHAFTDPKAELSRSFDFIASRLAAKAA